jgi:phosphate transport system substrate-binding protein
MRGSPFAGLALAAAGLLAGCGRSGSGLDGAGPEGSFQIAAAAPVAPAIEQQVARFERLYPAADVAVTPMTAREALVALVSGQADAAVVDRPMNAEERRAAAAAGLVVDTTKLGDGALVVAAAAGSTVEPLPLERLAAALEGAGPYRLALTSRNAGVVELLGDRLLGGRPPVPAFRAADEDSVLAWVVAGRPEGPPRLGVVSLAAWAQADSATVRGLRLLALPDSTGRPVLPSPMSVYRGAYPLVQPVYLYTVARRSPLAAPFATFAAGLHGQEAIQRAGLVPATLPAREIILN